MTDWDIIAFHPAVTSHQAKMINGQMNRAAAETAIFSSSVAWTMEFTRVSVRFHDWYIYDQVWYQICRTSPGSYFCNNLWLAHIKHTSLCMSGFKVLTYFPDIYFTVKKAMGMILETHLNESILSFFFHSTADLWHHHVTAVCVLSWPAHSNMQVASPWFQSWHPPQKVKTRTPGFSFTFYNPSSFSVKKS